MKKAEKLRKMVTRISAGVILAALLMFNVQIGVHGNGRSHLSLTKVAYGMYVPAMTGTGSGSTCYDSYSTEDPNDCGWWGGGSCPEQSFLAGPCPCSRANGWGPYDSEVCQ